MAILTAINADFDVIKHEKRGFYTSFPVFSAFNGVLLNENTKNNDRSNEP